MDQQLDCDLLHGRDGAADSDIRYAVVSFYVREPMADMQMDLFPGPEVDPRTGLLKSVADRRRKQAEAKEAQAARDRGMRRAESGNSKWIAEAVAAVRRVAQTHTEFTADDVWDDLESTADDRPRDGRALGPVMRKAAAAKLCRKTNRVQPCRRKTRHYTEIAVWMSLVYTGQRMEHRG